MELRMSGIMTPSPHVPAWREKKYFYARSQNCEKRLLDPSSLSVRPSVHPPVRKEHLGSQWTDLY